MSRDYDPLYSPTPGEYDDDPPGFTNPIPPARPPAPKPAELSTVSGAASPVSPFDWQKARERPDKVPGPPVRGFGPKGQFTLWLPSPMPTTAGAFVDGKYIVKQVAAGLTDPELLVMRRAVVDSAQSIGPGVLRVQGLFLDYAAGIIRRNYTVSDEELTMLLLSGDEWHNDVFEHCLGGPEIVSQLADMPDIQPPEGLLDQAAETDKLDEDYDWKPDKPVSPEIKTIKEKIRQMFTRIFGRRE
jgi:hypothetical protein